MSENDNGMPDKKLSDILIGYSKIVSLIALLVAFFTRQFGLPNILTYLIVGGTYLWIAWVLVSAIRSEAARRKLPFLWLKNPRPIMVSLIGLSSLVAVWFGYYGWTDYQASLPSIIAADENEILIIISDFENLPTDEVGLYFFQEFTEQIDLFVISDCGNPVSGGIRVCRLQGSEIIQDEDGALNWLQDTRASLVIWGWHIFNKFEPHMLVSPVTGDEWKPEDYKQIDLEVLTFDEMDRKLPESYKFLTAFAIARISYARGDYDEALRYLDLALDPDLLQTINDVVKSENWGAQYAYFTLGMVETARGNDADVPGYYDEALKLDPEFAAAYNNLGNFYAGKGNRFIKNAINNYTEAAEELAIALFNLGNLYSKTGDLCQAMNNYDLAIQRLERSLRFMAYHNRGALQIKLTNYQLAWEDFNNAIRFAPEDKEEILSYLYNSRAKASLALGRYEQTIEDLIMAISYYGEGGNGQYLIDSYSNKGVANVHLGRYDQAIRDMQEALKIDGDHNLIYYNLASAYAKSGEVEEAIQALDQAIQLDSSNAEYAACDGDFDKIRENPDFPREIQKPEGGCFEDASDDGKEIFDPCQR